MKEKGRWQNRMKREKVKKVVGYAVGLAYVGVVLVVCTLLYATYLFSTQGLFSNTPLYAFVLFYGYLLGALALMLWCIKNQDSLMKKALQKEKRNEE